MDKKLKAEGLVTVVIVLAVLAVVAIGGLLVYRYNKNSSLQSPNSTQSLGDTGVPLIQSVTPTATDTSGTAATDTASPRTLTASMRGTQSKLGFIRSE